MDKRILQKNVIQSVSSERMFAYFSLNFNIMCFLFVSFDCFLPAVHSLLEGRLEPSEFVRT